MIDAASITRERLLDALARDAIEPAFQCLVDLRDHDLKGFEVLARWTEADLGEVPPAVFIPAAERHGLIDALLVRVLTKACRAAAAWDGSFFLAFNLSPQQLQNAGLFGLIRAAAEAGRFPLTRLQMEITESALVGDIGVAAALVGELKRAGIRIALDDFGIGFSNLERLHAFAFDKIKIDASFVQDMEGDSDSRKIVASIIGLGQSLGVDVVAEGVETRAQADILRGLGCGLGQGWLFGYPVSAPDAAAALQRGFGKPAAVAALSEASPFQRRHQLEALYRHAPVALCFVDGAERCVSANNRFLEIVACAGSQFIGQRLAEMACCEARVRGLLAAVRDVAQGMASAPVEIEGPGEACYLAFVQPVHDEVGERIGTSIIMIDVTEQRRAERAIRESEEHFSRASDLSPDIAWAALPDGTINYMGPTFGVARNLSVEDRIEAWYGIMHPEDRVRVRREWLAWVPSGQPFEITFRIKWPDGSWHWVSSRARPHHGADGAIGRWYGLIVDITGRKALEHRIAVLEHQLDGYRRHAPDAAV
ncbi:EAL domain-containing protein [Ralstonia pseudosolanacearum]|uniref:sensor domain-containing phosphodiesterase n=1 Tax=Ralstonia pseudosolanacearum TaxID=1310165 RepID=UPI0018D02607|nr:EAL domain-containing protein [Ralstonia pseudosolanacearum]